MRLRPGVPVLVRPEGRVQVGIARPLLVDLDDQRSRDALALMESPGVPAARGPGPSAVALLRDADLIGENSPAPEPESVLISSAGRLGVEIGHALALAGIAVAFDDPAPTHLEPRTYSGRHLASTCGGAASWTVKDRHPWAPLGAAEPRAAVAIATGGVTRHVTARWEFDDLPHLLVTCDERGVDVGPLVVPGATACAGCVAHHARDRDEAWPTLLLQLEARRPWADPRIVIEAAGAASRLVLAELARAPEEAPPSRRWRFEPLAEPWVSEVAPHPDCGCLAA